MWTCKELCWKQCIERARENDVSDDSRRREAVVALSMMYSVSIFFHQDHSQGILANRIVPSYTQTLCTALAVHAQYRAFIHRLSALAKLLLYEALLDVRCPEKIRVE
jgi:hypothetical protein